MALLKKKRNRKYEEKEETVKKEKVKPEKDPLRKFHWGAFSFTMFWGLGHGMYLSLLCLIPICNFVIPFVFGFKGYRWAWERSYFKNIDAFLYSEESWNKAGIICLILCIVTIFIGLVMGLLLILNR